MSDALPATRPIVGAAERFLDRAGRVRLAIADASRTLTDLQLAQHHGISVPALEQLRADPDYIALVEEQIEYARNRAAFWRFELQNLGDQAIANARHYLADRANKHCWDATQFVLKSILPNEQTINIKGAQTPHISVEASVILEQRLTNYAASLAGAEAVPAIENDPNLRRPSRQ